MLTFAGGCGEAPTTVAPLTPPGAPTTNDKIKAARIKEYGGTGKAPEEKVDKRAEKKAADAAKAEAAKPETKP